MKIIIDVPEDVYNYIKTHDTGGVVVDEAIKNGTLLPKGHGRLIDAELLLNEISDLSTEPMTDLRLRLRNAPTIIEADNAESEDEECRIRHKNLN